MFINDKNEGMDLPLSNEAEDTDFVVRVHEIMMMTITC